VSSPTAPEPPPLDRPLSRDPRVRLARAQQPPLFAPEPPGALHNSLSHGDYSSAARPRRAPPRSSVADPDHYLGDSMSEGFYEMPATLRAAAFRPRPRQVGARRCPPSPCGCKPWCRVRKMTCLALRCTAALPQGFRSSGPRSLPRVHRVVAASSVRDPEPLHNSLGHGDYAPPPPPRR
jgi:hypothetical protein